MSKSQNSQNKSACATLWAGLPQGVTTPGFGETKQPVGETMQAKKSTGPRFHVPASAYLD